MAYRWHCKNVQWHIDGIAKTYNGISLPLYYKHIFVKLFDNKIKYTEICIPSGIKCFHINFKDVPHYLGKEITFMANETMNLNTPILTLDSDTVLETAQSKADLIWHDIQNAYRTRKILTGILGGIEKTEAGSLIAIIYYKDYRAVIPISEMMINLVQDEAHDYGDISLRQNKVLNNMLGCEIDFIIKGLDTKSRSIVASRKDAMLKKRQIFYFDQDSSGQTKIHEDRIVQARVIAVAEKVVRAEIFGVETSILARDLSFDWLGDARERFQVGEHILVRILTIQGDSPETLSIHADVKSVEGNTSKENLKNCRVQGKYAGTVEDIHKGTVFVRLELGVNAIAHSCYDSRTVGKKDKVSFVVTHIDEERNVAVGIITRIIKQNI